MAKIGRIILAVLAGATVWAVLWNLGTLGTQAALPDIVRPEQPLTHTGVLLAFIGYSVILSVLAGFITAWVGGKTPMPAVWSLAVLQLSMASRSRSPIGTSCRSGITWCSWRSSCRRRCMVGRSGRSDPEHLLPQ